MATQALPSTAMRTAFAQIHQIVETLASINTHHVRRFGKGRVSLRLEKVQRLLGGAFGDFLERTVFERDAPLFLARGAPFPLVVSETLRLYSKGKIKAHARVDHVLVLNLLESGTISVEHRPRFASVDRCIALVLGDEPDPPFADASSLLVALRQIFGAETPTLESYTASVVLHELMLGSGARLFQVLRRWPEAVLPDVALDYVGQCLEVNPFWSAFLCRNGYGVDGVHVEMERLARGPFLERLLAQMKDRVWMAAPILEKNVVVEVGQHLKALASGFRFSDVRRFVDATLSHRLCTFSEEAEVGNNVRAGHGSVRRSRQLIWFDVECVVNTGFGDVRGVYWLAAGEQFETSGEMLVVCEGEALTFRSTFSEPEEFREAIRDALEEDDQEEDDWV